MKEKSRKYSNGVTANLVFAWVFIAMFVYVIIECICEALYVGVIVALPFLLLAMQAFELHKREKEIDKLKGDNVLTMIILHDRWVHAHNRVVIYKKHFGDLTPEMEKELAEGERMAIEEESEKKEETKEE